MLTLALTSLWLQHVTLVVAYFSLLFLVLFLVRTRATAAGQRRFTIAFAILGLAACAIVNWWWHHPDRFVLQKSLPLHMCDLVCIIAPLALLTRWRVLRTLLHFLGIALCSQWLFTPVVHTGPRTIEFWISFLTHASIFGCAACDVFIGGYRPSRDWKDWRTAFLFGILYALLMVPLDIAIDANYGYVGRTTPDVPTIVDALGPWPLRIVWIILLATLALTLVQLAWHALDRLGIQVGPPDNAPNRKEPRAQARADGAGT